MWVKIACSLTHQYQRAIKTIPNPSVDEEPIEYIEVEPSDIKLANQLAHEILGRSLDELPPQTRKLLNEIQQMVEAQCKAQSIKQSHFRFSRKTIRDVSQWSDGQLKIHCKRLEELEYLLVHRGGRGVTLEYELLYTGDTRTDKAQMMGLLDIEKLKENQHYDENKLGQKKQKTASSKTQVSAKSDKQKTSKAISSIAYRESSQTKLENAHPAL